MPFATPGTGSLATNEESLGSDLADYAQRSLLSSQDALTSNQGDIALSMIALYKSVGGGWEQFEQRGSADIVASR